MAGPAATLGAAVAAAADLMRTGPLLAFLAASLGSLFAGYLHHRRHELSLETQRQLHRRASQAWLALGDPALALAQAQPSVLLKLVIAPALQVRTPHSGPGPGQGAQQRSDRGHGDPARERQGAAG